MPGTCSPPWPAFSKAIVAFNLNASTLSAQADGPAAKSIPAGTYSLRVATPGAETSGTVKLVAKTGCQVRSALPDGRRPARPAPGYVFGMVEEQGPGRLCLVKAPVVTESGRGRRACFAAVVAAALGALCAGTGLAGTAAASTATEAGSTGSRAAAPKHPCPTTAAEVTAAFGEKLVGPKPALNAYDVCVFDSANKSLFDVVEISIFTPANLKVMHSSAKKYMTASRHPEAKAVSGLGLQAYIQDDNVFIRTSAGEVLDVGANFPASRAALVRVAHQVLSRIS